MSRPSPTAAAGSGLRPWASLDATEQLKLREAFGHWQDGLPPTCDLLSKQERFAQWLRERGVLWLPGD